ncbi:MAG TPA: GGDEF domain-containing protein [Phycisphaerae bacterium]|nr:GGDEF domain-containing protein [Phycisphaerae bacterium]
MPMDENNQTLCNFVFRSDNAPARKEARKAFLIVMSGSRAGEMYPLQKPEVTVGRAPGCDIVLDDPSVSRVHARFLLDAEGKVTVADNRSTNGTYVDGAAVVTLALRDGQRIEFGGTTILKFSYQDTIEEEFQRGLFENAIRDGLTQVYNRRYFMERLAADVSHAIRHVVPLSLLMLDLDHFKKVNDTYGHPAGDFVLRQLAMLIGNTLREEDILARYGGEEFVLILRDTDAARAEVLAERVRRLVERTPFRHEGRLIEVTVSVGVTTLGGSIDSAEAMVREADRLLYDAKHCGRNRIRSADMPMVETS